MLVLTNLADLCPDPHDVMFPLSSVNETCNIRSVCYYNISLSALAGSLF